MDRLTWRFGVDTAEDSDAMAALIEGFLVNEMDNIGSVFRPDGTRAVVDVKVYIVENRPPPLFDHDCEYCTYVGVLRTEDTGTVKEVQYCCFHVQPRLVLRSGNEEYDFTAPAMAFAISRCTPGDGYDSQYSMAFDLLSRHHGFEPLNPWVKA